MDAEMTPADLVHLLVLRAAGREISNTEMEAEFGVRLLSPNYQKLNAAGYVESATKRTPYRHKLTEDGISLFEGKGSAGEKRGSREKPFWAGLTAVQRLPADGKPTEDLPPDVVEEPASLAGRIRAAYAELTDGPGRWVDLVVLRPLLSDVSKAELDEALEQLLDDPAVQLAPEPVGHRVGPQGRAAAVRIGGDDRHKLAIGLP